MSQEQTSLPTRTPYRSLMTHPLTPSGNRSLLAEVGVADTPFREVLWLAGAKLPPGPAIDLRQVDWSRVIATVYEQRMLPLLHGALVEQLGRLEGNETRLRLLWNAQRENAQRNLALAAETLHLLDTLEKEGVPVLAFKGCVLSLAVYGNLSTRKGGDIDLLVRREDVWRALEILERCDYRSFRERSPAEAVGHLTFDCEWELLNARKRMGVDLHWDFSGRNCGLPVPALLRHIWSRQTTTQLCGRQIRSLTREDLVLMLCIHAAKHYWQRLEWIHTLTHLLNQSPDLDWASLFAFARACRTERILALGLVICDEVYGLRVAIDGLEAMRADRQLRSLAKRSLEWLFHGRPDTLSSTALRKYNADTRTTAAAKSYYWMCAAMTPTAKDYLIELPSKLRWVYYLIRANRLVGLHIARFFNKREPSAPGESIRWIPDPEIVRSRQPDPNKT